MLSIIKLAVMYVCCATSAMRCQQTWAQVLSGQVLGPLYVLQDRANTSQLVAGHTVDPFVQDEESVPAAVLVAEGEAYCHNFTQRSIRSIISTAHHQKARKCHLCTSAVFMISACRHPGCDRCCERGPQIRFDYCCVWWRTLVCKQLTDFFTQLGPPALLPAALSALSDPWQYIVYTLPLLQQLSLLHPSWHVSTT